MEIVLRGKTMAADNGACRNARKPGRPILRAVTGANGEAGPKGATGILAATDESESAKKNSSYPPDHLSFPTQRTTVGAL